MTITSGLNMITRQMTSFFCIYLLISIGWSISSLHFKAFKTQFIGVPLCSMFWYVKCTFTCQIFKPVNIDILFLRNIC